MTLEILMPFYGRIDHFKAAVTSVLSQSDPNWRLTVVDDVYPDLSAGEWVKEISDPRVRYFRNDVNLGISGNFRRCVELVGEEYAVIMGCDDLMLPNFVGQFSGISSQFCDVAVFQLGVRVIDANGRPCWPLADRVKALYRPKGRSTRVLAGEKLATSLLRGNWAYFPSLVWRADILRRVNFRPDLDVALDLALLLEIVASGGAFLLDDVVVFEYRRHIGSVSAFTATDGSRFIEEREVFWDAASRFQRMGWKRAASTGRHYLSSRLNAFSVLPRAIKSARPADRRVLINHILGLPQKAREAVDSQVG